MSSSKKTDVGDPTRREFLGGATVACSLSVLATAPSIDALASVGPGFEQRYRDIWTWDDVHRGTHNLNCWYQQNCCFHIYTRDGVVIREEQVGDYPQTHPGVPDFNPRGCQKGCSYSSLMYSEPRILSPLKRVGERGEGEWAEVSWDEALTDIANKVIDAITEHGPDSVVLDTGGNAVNHLAIASMYKLFDQLDSTVLDVNCELGDDQQGAAVTYGEPTSDRSADDYFYSDLVFIWGGNPAYTQIPNFHFLTEARYNGTRIVAISPDLNASAMHADLWVPVRPGTDAALALAMAKVVIDEELYDAQLIREQTDLPMLVNVENGKLLRESDLRMNGSRLKLFRWDTGRDKLDKVDRDTLRLGSRVPALEGRFEVEGRRGEIVVTPAFELLKKKLENYTPEKATALCGVAPDTIRELARMLAGAKAATNTCTSGISKFYHGDLMMRAQILVFLLCGQLGRKGAGYVAGSMLVADGLVNMIAQLEQVREQALPTWMKHGQSFMAARLGGASQRMATYGLLEDTFVESRALTNSTLFWNYHGGLLDVSGRSHEWDPELPRDVKEYVDEALRQRWQVLDPIPPKEPRALFVWMGNTLRRVRGSNHVREVLWPKLDLVVVLDLRMSTTALHADYVLPVSGAYEKVTTMSFNTNPISPFLHTTAAAVDSVGNSRDEWDIACLLAKKIQEQAIARNSPSFDCRHHRKQRLDTVYDEMTRHGRLGEGQGEKLSKKLVESSTNLGGVSFKELKDKGYVRFSGLGHHPSNWGNACDIEDHQTISPHTWHTEKKEPWATLSGRVQFYIDHDWYLELGEELPVHKPPPTAGGDYPLTMTGGHARWSIHATWRSDPTMLRLQRGEPYMWMSVEDAAARELGDDDRIRVFNDVGSFLTRVKISANVMPGQVIIYHGWEGYQYEGGMGYRTVQATPLNPIELVGDYPGIRPQTAIRQPGQNDRDTRVEVVRA